MTANATTNAALGTGAVTLNGGTLQILATASSLANTTVTGFGTSGTGWTVNSAGISSTPISADVLTLTDNGGSEARSAFFNTPVPVTVGALGFTASFTYTVGGYAANGNKAADGMAFILQNQSTSARGGGGSGLGYQGITPSAAVVLDMNINSPAAGAPGELRWPTNGTVPAFTSVTPVTLTSGDAINVNLSYNPAGQTLTETLTDATANTTFTKVYTGVNLAATLGGNTALVGFSGGDGAITSTQQISNFSYSVGGSPAGAYANNVVLTGGDAATIDVGATAANPTVSMGTLAVGNGTLTQLNVTGSTVPVGQAYGLTLGATTLAGNVTFNVANNTNGAGNAVGTLTLGAVSGSGFGVTLTGRGNALLLGGTNTYTGATTVLGGTLRVNGANGSLAAGSAVTIGGTTAGGDNGAPALAGSGTINIRSRSWVSGTSNGVAAIWPPAGSPERPARR